MIDFITSTLEDYAVVDIFNHSSIYSTYQVMLFAEKARIEAQIKAAEAATRRKELDDAKMRRERERKAARMALEKVHISVYSVSDDSQPNHI